MDSQSVMNTDTAEQKGYDAGNEVSGIKRHIALDTQGLPHAIQVTTADVTDRAGALSMFDEDRSDLNRVHQCVGGLWLHREALCCCSARHIRSLGGSGDPRS